MREHLALCETTFSQLELPNAYKVRLFVWIGFLNMRRGFLNMRRVVKTKNNNPIARMLSTTGSQFLIMSTRRSISSDAEKPEIDWLDARSAKQPLVPYTSRFRSIVYCGCVGVGNETGPATRLIFIRRTHCDAFFGLEGPL